MRKAAVDEVLNWTSRQTRILTGGGVAEELYQKPRFPFNETELPHYWLERGCAVDEFRRQRTKFPLVGAYERRLFCGGFDYTTNVDEECCNVQTSSLFVDIRIPRLRDEALKEDPRRILARQHAFAGLTVYDDPVATRFHSVDWNYFGRGRSRPNKWRVECGDNGFKEWSYATDKYDQSYYFELWHNRTEPTNQLAFISADGRAVFTLVGDVFAYAVNRRLFEEDGYTSCAAAMDDDPNDDRLNLLAGHGTLHDGDLYVQASLQPQHQGQFLADVIGINLPMLYTLYDLPFSSSSPPLDFVFPASTTTLLGFDQVNVLFEMSPRRDGGLPPPVAPSRSSVLTF